MTRGDDRSVQVLLAAVRVYLGLVFVAAAWFKILQPYAFALSVATYRILPLGAVNALAIVLPWIEIVVGLALVLGVWTRAAALVVAGLLVVFTGAIGSAIARGFQMSCGCFSSQQAAAEIGTRTLLRDGAWLVGALLVAWRDRGRLGLDRVLGAARRGAPVVLVLLGMALASAPARAGGIPWRQIPMGGSLSDSQKKIATAFFDTTQCYYGCEGTITDCLKKAPTNDGPLRLAAFIVRRLLSGDSTEKISEGLHERKISAFPPEVKTIDTSGLDPLGDPAAPVRVVVFADFQCPYCRVADKALERLVAEMPGKVVVYFENFPIKTHAQAITAATAALAAARQGKFWEMHDLLFANQNRLFKKEITKLAKTIPLDARRFTADLADKTLLDRIRAEKMRGIDLGVTATPGIFFNGKLYHGAKSYGELSDRLEEELAVLAIGNAPSR